jgi:V8-like Glu-specific endopeptidase
MAFDPTAYPYDTVVRITDTIGNEEYQASGVLISPDEVLTASHVLYIAGVGAASDIVVTPAYGDGAAPYGSADGTYVHYFPIDDANGQISNADSQSDYAVIHLSSPFTGIGTMGLSSNFAGGPVTIAGYPASANGAMVTSTQTVYRDPNYTLLDGVTLGKGSSGGPVFVGGATDPQVVGIVSSESNVPDRLQHADYHRGLRSNRTMSQSRRRHGDHSLAPGDAPGSNRNRKRLRRGLWAQRRSFLVEPLDPPGRCEQPAA